MPTRRAALKLMASVAAHPRPLVRASSAALVAAARRQIGVTKSYDHGYHQIAYPGGDVSRSTGVCSDVIVRAARDAWGLDLQRLVHEDMGRAFSAYPQRWRLAAPDSNIDHRRVPNLEIYWTRAGALLWRAKSPMIGFGFPGPLLAGDILTWRTFLNGGPHVAIVSNAKGWPRIIQNSGWGVHEDWLAQQWLDAANAHFRWLPQVS